MFMSYFYQIILNIGHKGQEKDEYRVFHLCNLAKLDELGRFIWRYMSWLYIGKWFTFTILFLALQYLQIVKSTIYEFTIHR